MRALWLVEDCVICRYNHLGGDYGIKFQTRCHAFRHKSHLGRERKRQLTTTHEAKRPVRNWVEYIAPLCFRSDLAVVVSAIFVLEYHLECHFVSCHQILVVLVLLHNFTKYILEIVVTVVLSFFTESLSSFMTVHLFWALPSLLQCILNWYITKPYRNHATERAMELFTMTSCLTMKEWNYY